jgi:hypothetical protein
VLLELSVTSNWITNNAVTKAAHPIRKLWDAGDLMSVWSWSGLVRWSVSLPRCLSVSGSVTFCPSVCLSFSPFGPVHVCFARFPSPLSLKATTSSSGVLISINTDDPGVFGLANGIVDEVRLQIRTLFSLCTAPLSLCECSVWQMLMLQAEHGFTREEFVRCNDAAFRKCFIPGKERFYTLQS